MTQQVILWGIAVAAGAGFVWGREKHMPSYGQLSPDRRMRLALPGVICLGVFFWPIHIVYVNYFSTFTSPAPKNPPAAVWVLCSVAPFLPWLVGYLFGWSQKMRWERRRDRQLVSKEQFTERRRERRRLRHEQRQNELIPHRTYPTALDYVMERITGELTTDPPSMVTIVFTYPNNSEPYVVLGYVGYAPSGPNTKDIYLDAVYFLDTYKAWREFVKHNEHYTLMRCGFLINYERVIYIQVEPSIAHPAKHPHLTDKETEDA